MDPALMWDSLPDVFSPDWLAAMRDVLSLGLAALGAWLAWLSIRMGRENDKMAQKQTALAESMNGLLTRLSGLEEKQAQIAERQHEVFEREARKKAVLKVVLPNPTTRSGEKSDRYQLYIKNEGDKPGSGFWYLGIPKQMRERVTVTPSNGNEEVVFPADNWDIYSDFDQPQVMCFTDDYYLLKFMMTQPVEPDVMMPCATVSVEWKWAEDDWMGQKSSEYRNQARRIFGWFTKGSGGRVPETGMRKLRMYSRMDSAFKNYHGGTELPEDDPDDFS